MPAPPVSNATTANWTTPENTSRDITIVGAGPNSALDAAPKTTPKTAIASPSGAAATTTRNALNRWPRCGRVVYYLRHGLWNGA